MIELRFPVTVGCDADAFEGVEGKGAEEERGVEVGCGGGFAPDVGFCVGRGAEGEGAGDGVGGEGGGGGDRGGHYYYYFC